MKRNLLKVTLVLVVCLCIVLVLASCGNSKSKLEFTSNGDGTCSVTGIGKCKDTELVIPDVSPDGDRVTGIGDNAFFICTKLTSVTIPDSVTSIGENAFAKCFNLTSATIPNGVTSIGNSAFEECGALESVYIPNSVTSIGENAFRSCTDLTKISIGSGVTSIGIQAFGDCTKVEEIYYNAAKVKNILNHNSVFNDTGKEGDESKVVIGKNVIEIPRYLFCDTKITSVEFEEGSVCESIGAYAFYNCTSLESVTISDSVTSIGEDAFYECAALTSVTFANPSGWRYFSILDAEFGTGIVSTALANPSTAATYLKSTYCGNWWKRI